VNLDKFLTRGEEPPLKFAKKFLTQGSINTSSVSRTSDTARSRRQCGLVSNLKFLLGGEEMEENSVAISLEQITLEVKFYLNQTAQNIIEVGKRLTQAKDMLPHGEFGNWLDKKFCLTIRTAQKFMQVSERFGNTPLTAHLNQTQMIEMLALPESETEKFIEQKKNEGTPVEDMTIKTLRAEVNKWKNKVSENAAEVNSLKSENEKLQHNLEVARQTSLDNGNLYRDMKAKFENLQAEKNVEVLPKDYESNKLKISELQNKIEKLQSQLKNKPVEIVTPADYDATKKELAMLQAEHSEIVQSMEVFQKLDTVARLIRDISNSPSDKGIENFAREKNDRFGGMCADFKGFIKAYGSLYDKYLEAV
jgi:hypothetical protein